MLREHVVVAKVLVYKKCRSLIREKEQSKRPKDKIDAEALIKLHRNN